MGPVKQNVVFLLPPPPPPPPEVDILNNTTNIKQNKNMRVADLFGSEDRRANRNTHFPVYQLTSLKFHI